MTSQFCGHARATRVTRVAEVATMVAGWRKHFQTKVSPPPRARDVTDHVYTHTALCAAPARQGAQRLIVSGRKSEPKLASKSMPRARGQGSARNAQAARARRAPGVRYVRQAHAFSGIEPVARPKNSLRRLRKPFFGLPRTREA